MVEPGTSTHIQVRSGSLVIVHHYFDLLNAGCGCDVPSALYSFSFALNPNWTKLMPSNTEIKEYVDNVVDTYNLRRAMTFGTEVVRSVWREDANRWILYLRELETGRQYTHECQILFAATGQLVEPRPCDIPGASDFGGSIFHSARWDHSVDLEGKNVVVIGNGCMKLLSFSPRFQRVSLTFFRYCCTDRPSSSKRGKD